MISSETLDLLEWQRLCQHLTTFTATKLGLIAARNLRPFQTREESLQLLAQTQEAYSLEVGLTPGLSFEGIEDIGDSLERAERQGMLSPEALLEIATTLAGMRNLRRRIEEEEEIPVLTELVAEVRTYPEIEQDIHHCIDERAKVADRASARLGEIRHSMKGMRDRIYQKLQHIMQQRSGAVQQQSITQRGDRFVIPVKAPQKDAIRGIVHDTSSTGATLYIEPHSIVEWGNQLRQLRRQEQGEEEAILRRLTEKVAEVTEDLEHLLAIATILDLATAKARYSLWLEANPPHFIEGETITLRELRHPLLVWQQKHEHGINVVPIDVQISPETRVVAITGPNTGGKTVTLKTIGLAAMMAKVGLFVPAKEPVELPWFENVLADIGDEQSLEQSLSTFSGHITRITRIIEAIGNEKQHLPLSADGKSSDSQTKSVFRDSKDTSTELNWHEYSSSLILLDEVGAGTDPAEGSALATALLKYFADTTLLTIATTHYGELKALKYHDDRFENASVEFDEQTLQPTYRLLWGIPGRSNALTIAKRLGLPNEIINHAQERVGGFSEDVNQVIAGLEEQRKRQETKAQEASQLLKRAEKFYGEVSERAENLRAREQELKQSQEEAVNEAIAQAKSEIAKVIRQLQQGKPTAQKAQKATEAVNEIAQQQRPQKEPKKPPKGYTPEVGEKIRIPRLNQTAEVLTAPEDGEISVRFGIMKMTIPLTDIESLDGKKPEPPKAKARTSTPTPTPATPAVQTSQNTLDIRGSRVMDAERELENAIADAVAKGMNKLWIIHGKGTGKLRQGVHEFLKDHPQVSTFELAPQKEGGTGVTIVDLA